MKCSFYDDGHGNGGYCSGMNVGPSVCKLSKNPLSPKCNGLLQKCELDTNEVTIRNLKLTRIQKELEEIKSKL
jgi:hypothetical protein